MHQYLYFYFFHSRKKPLTSNLQHYFPHPQLPKHIPQRQALLNDLPLSTLYWQFQYSHSITALSIPCPIFFQPLTLRDLHTKFFSFFIHFIAFSFDKDVLAEAK
jgi:hypothetical protein